MESKSIKQQLEFFCGGWNVKPIDLSGSLIKHPTKKYKTRKLSKINKIVVHCTDRNWTILQLNHYDVEGFLKLSNGDIEVNHIDPSGLPGITYHDVFMMDGKIYHTLPYEEVSWHAGGYNTGSVAVSLMYPVKNSFGYPQSPSEGSIKALQCHLGKLCLRFGLTPDRVFGHRELKGTGWFFNSQGSKRLRKTCPGMAVDLDLLRTNVATYMQIVLQISGYYVDLIDGDFGKRSRAALESYLKG